MSKQITGATSIFGVLGYPIQHSLSPLIHNQLASELNHDLVYVPFPVSPETLEKAIEGAWALEIQGLNVTIPHKESVIPYLVHVDSFAMKMGAVNTLKRTAQGYEGYNTDGMGLLQSLTKHRITLKGKTMMILGSGGAARAAAIMGASQGVRQIWIVNRTIEHAEKLLKDVKQFYSIEVEVCSWDQLKNIENMPSIDLCIQTTPIGMYPYAQMTPIDDPNFFSHIQTAVDLIYNPLETQFLSLAKQAGCNIINGLEMLVFQGIKAYELWKECTISLDLQEKVLKNMEQYFISKDEMPR
ncbi:MAG: shikimate dehydrogenase [Epulopiscium sp.]|nr:shikimate dehydrogenase [Candidatus Epulonipiscium sp.]